jgi:hypothetical protein
MAEDRISVPADKVARFVLSNGHVDLHYDPDRDQIVVMCSAKGRFVVIPRAGNSVVLEVHDGR